MKPAVICFFLALFLSIIVVCSELPDISNSVPGYDHYRNHLPTLIWSFWSAKHLLFKEFPNPYRSGYTPLKKPGRLTQDLVSPLNVWLSIFFQFFVTPITTFNILLILHFAFTCWGMYCFLKSLQIPHTCAFAGGIMFAFSPLVFEILNHGFNPFVFTFIPIHYFFLFRFITEGKHGKDAFFAAVFWVLSGLSSPLSLGVFVFSFLCLWFLENTKPLSKRVAVFFKSLFLIIVPLLALSYLFQVPLKSSFYIGYEHWSYVKTLNTGTDISRYMNYYGIIPLALLPLGIFSRQYSKHWIFIIPLIFMAMTWIVDTDFLPVNIIMLFILCTLAALGLSELVSVVDQNISRYTPVVLVCIIFEIIFFNIIKYPALNPQTINSPSWCDWMKNQNDDFAILEIPRWFQQRSLTNQIFHGKRNFSDYSLNEFEFEVWSSSLELHGFLFLNSHRYLEEKYYSPSLISRHIKPLFEKYNIKYLVFNYEDEDVLKYQQYKNLHSLYTDLFELPEKKFPGAYVYAINNLCKPELCKSTLVRYIEIGIFYLDAVHVQDFYSPERVSGTPFRWSGKDSVIFLSLGDDMGDFILKIRFARHLATKKVHIRFMLNQHLLDRFEMGEKPFIVKEYFIEKNPEVKGVIPFHIYNDAGGPGIMVDWIRVEPLETRPSK